jgi:hypothetical protein
VIQYSKPLEVEIEFVYSLSVCAVSLHATDKWTDIDLIERKFLRDDEGRQVASHRMKESKTAFVSSCHFSCSRVKCYADMSLDVVNTVGGQF